MSMIGFEDVTFSYSRRRPLVIDRLSWTPGRREALLGPNGAGKSTLIRLATGALVPVAGHVRRPAGPAPGYLPQANRPVGSLNAREQVALCGWMKGMSRTAAWDAAATALDRVELGSKLNHRVCNLSGGQLRRVGLAEVLVDDPPVALLDEPAVGLDPLQRSRLRDVLREIEFAQMVVSTHQVDDIQQLVDSVTVLVGGRIAFQGTVQSFLDLGADDADGFPAERAYRKVLRSVGGQDE